MSGEHDEGSGAAHKLGIGAALLAALGGLTKIDDCGRVAARSASVGDDVARGGTRLGDDVARGATPADDQFRRGALGDDLGRGARPAVAGTLPESPVLHVVDDAAPGTGASLEEALKDVGVDVAFEVITIELPAPSGEDEEPLPDAPAPPVRVLAAATWPAAAEELDGAAAGEVASIIVAIRGDGTFAFGPRRTTEAALHARCVSGGVRCVIATCPEDDATGCVALAAGMSRRAATTVPAVGGPTLRSVRFADAMIRLRASMGAREIGISRLDVDHRQMVRSRLADAAPPPAPSRGGG